MLVVEGGGWFLEDDEVLWYGHFGLLGEMLSMR